LLLEVLLLRLFTIVVGCIVIADALDKDIQDSLYTNCNSGDTMNKRNNNTSNNNSEQTQ
jgi:hypothetical protein